MKTTIVCAFVINCCLNPVAIKANPVPQSVGEQLILTPFLEQDNAHEARRLSRVHLDGFNSTTSYSGYFTVNKLFNSNQFFWFFPAELDHGTAPIILWLQGGPGWSSLFGLFMENGPFKIVNDTQLELREDRWTIDHSIIYIDNPVGTGYSFTDGGYCRNQTQIGHELYNSLQQFFRLFPEYRNNELFIAGESYAGKYLPALAHTIHKLNPNADLRINLKGLMIGNGFTDPINQLQYAEYLYQVGLVDIHAKAFLEQCEQDIVRQIQSGQLIDAFHSFSNLIFAGENTFIANLTGFVNIYNFLKPEDFDNTKMPKLFQTDAVRAAIHVGDQDFGDGSIVQNHLLDDVMQSVAPWIAEAIDNYKVLIYCGQLDIIVAYPLTMNYLNQLNFSAASEYRNAKRRMWYVNQELAGYVKQAGNLTEVLIRDAGHMVPFDQPIWGHELIRKFTRHQPFH